jgi:hypothetical protein
MTSIVMINRLRGRGVGIVFDGVATLAGIVWLMAWHVGNNPLGVCSVGVFGLCVLADTVHGRRKKRIRAEDAARFDPETFQMRPK